MSTTEHPAVSAFREYLRIPSVHPNPDYGPCVEFFKAQGNALGLPAKVFGTKEKPVVVLSWEGKRPEMPSIVFNSHMDVVPVFPEKWTYPPFAGHKTEDGKIYGRGAQDMKILAIQYLAAVKELKSEGFHPTRTLHFLHVPDEEIGGAEGMEKFVETDEFKKLNIGLALDEGTASTTGNYIVYNDERCKWAFNILCNGPTGHGSLLHSNTAGEKMRLVLDKMFDRRAELVKQMEGRDTITYIGNVTTINLTIVEGGVQNNVVPDCIKLCFDVRLSVHEDHDQFLKWIHDVCEYAGQGTKVEFVIKDDKIPKTPTDSSVAFWPVMKDVLEKLGKKIEVAPCCGASDMRFVRKKGIPAFGFSPLLDCPVLLHDHDEYVLEREFIEGISVYVELMKALSAVP